ncbi:rCG53501 [Rattus norvegicus]|uniref:RCG53501 n=1 Tax=Rattus norvegicus TaxID=10116 RepID=A6JRS1_RAT|nr:rCG53501 [Rattus norvegicus]
MTFNLGEHLSVPFFVKAPDWWMRTRMLIVGASERLGMKPNNCLISALSCLWSKCPTINLNEGAKSDSGFYSSNSFR